MAVENIIGGALRPDIITQLEKRQELLGQTGTRGISNLLYNSNKNCWIKMSSFTEFIGPGSLDIIRGLLDNEVPISSVTSLASDWTLIGGTAYNSVDSRGLVNDTPRYGVSTPGGAYGAGGIKELGYRPMPGITSFTAEALPPVGAAYSATVKLKAWNINQLSILDMLYFRLGFYCLIEWGHTVFVDNVGHVHTDIFQTINTQKPGITYTDVQEQIKIKRQQSGYNYDAMIGMVTNYDWTQNRDGSYDCSVKFTGAGSLAESLKINSNANMPVTTGPVDETTVNQTNPEVIDSALKSFLTKVRNFANKNAVSTTTPDIAGFQTLVKQCFSSGRLKMLDKLDPSAPVNSLSDRITYGFSTKYMKATNAEKLELRKSLKPLTIDDFVIYTTLAGTVVPNHTLKSTQSFFCYIPLSLLLAYINNSCLTYQGSDSSGLPLQYIDFNPYTSTCLRIPQQLSTDPSVCIIDTTTNFSDFTTLFTSKGVDISKITYPISSATGCTVNDKLKALNISYLHSVTSQKTNHKNDSAYVGDTLNVMVNVDYLLSLYDKQLGQDQKTKNINLASYVKEILDGISTALGGINQLQLITDGADPTSDVMSVVDVQTQDFPETIPTLNVAGLENQTVRELSLKTEVSTKYGSSLAIQAMYDSSNPNNNPTGTNMDVSAFVTLNNRLRDRLRHNTSLKTDTSAATNTTTKSAEDIAQEKQQQETAAAQAQKEQDDLVSLANQVNSFFNHVYGFTSSPVKTIQIPIDSVGSVQNYYQDALLKIKNGNSTTADHIAANGVLPLALNMTLDGIAGIPLFEAFTIPANRLPVQYLSPQRKQLIGFTVAGLSHTIEGNQWTTSVRGLMINIPTSARISPPNPAPRAVPPPAEIRNVSPSKIIQDIYIPALNKALPSISKGAKLLLSAQAQNEGFFPGSKSYRTNNPGNVGNTGTGTKTFPTLEAGIQAQWNKVLKGAFNGTSQYYKPTDTLLQYLSNYAPVSDGNNPPQYANFVVGYFKKQGVTITPNTTLAEINKIV